MNLAPAPATLQIEVELISLEVLPTAATLARWLACLPAAEQARAAQLRRAEDRAAFVACRHAVRRRLAQHASLAPLAVPIVLGRFGKPRCGLSGMPHFSISHCRGLAAVGWSADDIGVDVELAATSSADEGVAAMILSSAEHTHYLDLPAAQRGAYLMRQFSAKEAVLKAMGTGMSIEPHLLTPTLDGFAAPLPQCSAPHWQVTQTLWNQHWLVSAAAQASQLSLQLQPRA